MPLSVTVPSLTPLDLALASVFAMLAGALSLAANLKLERAFAIAFLRMVVQLTLVGIVLKYVFEQGDWYWTLGVALVMVLVAGWEAINRVALGTKRASGFALATGTLTLVGVASTLLTTLVIIAPTPWYAPSVVLPILGLILGNGLSALSLALLTITETAARDRRAIEARLALGATRFEALGQPIRSAIRTGLTPVINMLAVAGIVALPGMMTGQILAGADPLEAAKYQIMILAVLAGTAALSVIAGSIGGVLLLTDRRDRLRLPE